MSMWKPKPKKAKAKRFGLVKGFGADAEAERAPANAVTAAPTAVTSARAKRQALELQKAALEEDATVFDYDGVYDDLVGTRQATEAAAKQEKATRKSKYTANLLKQAEMRKLADDRVYERKLRKEAAEVAQQNGDVKDEDKFVGAAYRRQLEERERYEAVERAEAEAEAKNDVTRTGMGGFYQNLLSRNVAMGGDVAHAKSSFTVGSKQSKKLTGETSSDSGSDADAGDADAGGATAAPAGPRVEEALPDYTAAKQGSDERYELERQFLMKKVEREGLAGLRKGAVVDGGVSPAAVVGVGLQGREEEDETQKKVERKKQLSAAKERALARKRKREEEKAAAA